MLVRFKHRVFPASGGVEGMGVEIYTDARVARIQEKGGIVQARGGGKLAVPLSARQGMFTARGKLKKRYKTPGRLKNVREMRLKGKSFLVRFWKRREEIKPLFVLKNKIRVRPRLGFYNTWNDMAPFRITRLNRAVSKALARR